MNYGQGGHQSYPQDLQICYRLFFIAVLIISLRCRHNWAVLIFTNNSLHTTVGPISQWSVPFMFQLTSSSLRRHEMLIFSALLAFCEGNPRSAVTGGLPSQRPVTWGFDVLFDVRLNKRLSKQSRCWYFETPWRLLWRHSNYALNVAIHVFG